MKQTVVRLYHGSNTAIESPEISFNTGFADLGKGFYLTPDSDAARKRAKKRAQTTGGVGVVSIFDLDVSCVPWVTWEEKPPPSLKSGTGTPFGLCFEASRAGYAAWAGYIQACRSGQTEIPGMGSPAVVRAWIATMEVEMVCSGFLPTEDFAEAVDPTELITQYCVLDQDVLDGSLVFVDSQTVS